MFIVSPDPYLAPRKHDLAKLPVSGDKMDAQTGGVSQQKPELNLKLWIPNFMLLLLRLTLGTNNKWA